jgi:glycosyltransferase involved in cell wall biosynthesis
MRPVAQAWVDEVVAATGAQVDVVLGLDQRSLAKEVYNQARTYLQPSWIEGFGFTAVEAMACGTALVTTDNGGSRDYAHDEATALVAAPGDHAGLAAQLLRMLDDDALRTRLAAAGEAAAQVFDWDEGARLLEGHLEAYLADPGAFLTPLEHRTDPEYDPSVEVLGHA